MFTIFVKISLVIIMIFFSLSLKCYNFISGVGCLVIYWSCLWSCSCHHDDANLVKCVIFDCWFKSEIITFIKINIYINWIISRCFLQMLI